jgi:hypothetical protein
VYEDQQASYINGKMGIFAKRLDGLKPLLALKRVSKSHGKIISTCCSNCLFLLKENISLMPAARVYVTSNKFLQVQISSLIDVTKKLD